MITPPEIMTVRTHARACLLGAMVAVLMPILMNSPSAVAADTEDTAGMHGSKITQIDP